MARPAPRDFSPRGSSHIESFGRVTVLSATENEITFIITISSRECRGPDMDSLSTGAINGRRGTGGGGSHCFRSGYKDRGVESDIPTRV